MMALLRGTALSLFDALVIFMLCAASFGSAAGTVKRLAPPACGK
jgi:hypothetical protein